MVQKTVQTEKKMTTSNSETKIFTIQAQTGIKGEAFFEMLVSNHCIPHQISGLKDIGIDYMCQWINGNTPTGLLFLVQVKCFNAKNGTIESIKKDERYNFLEKYKITNSKNLELDDRTLTYLASFGLPTYLFVVVINDNKQNDCYYQRLTPILLNGKPFKKSKGFSKVTDDNSDFLAFADKTTKEGGFARDLYIDYVRCNYSKGNVALSIKPSTMGLQQFPFIEKADDYDVVYFSDLAREYEKNIEQSRKALIAIDNANRKSLELET